MFISREFFERMFSSNESSAAWERKIVNDSLDRVLAAKETETQAVMAAYKERIAQLEGINAELRKDIGHERSRGEAAVDRLLAKEAGVRDIRHADIETRIVEQDMRDKRSRASELGKVFAEMGRVGEIGEEVPSELGI